MTPNQRKARNTLERSYLEDLKQRTLKAPCPRCKAKKNKPCTHDDGPRKGQPMAKYHGERSHEANKRGYVKGPNYWRWRKT